MKAATGSFGIEHVEKAVEESQDKSQSGLARYALVAALVTVMFLLSSWNPSADATSGFHLGSGFVWFWLVGGFITLSLLFMAAKRPD